MRESELGSLKYHSRTENHKSNNGFVIREIPIQRMNREAQCATTSNNCCYYNNDASSDFGGVSKGKRFCDAEKATMNDYDTPEMVVFLQEDTQVSRRKLGKESDSEFYKGTMETVPSVSNESVVTKDATNMCSFRNLVKMVVEGDRPTQNTMSDFHEEGMDEEQEFPRQFNRWHNVHPFFNTNSSRMEFPRCGQLPETQTMSSHEGGNSRSVDGHSSSSSSAVPATTTAKSGSTSHQSSDSISSAHSFTFPILPTEWSGSPVRMAEADRSSQSRRHRWRKICCPCCTF